MEYPVSRANPLTDPVVPVVRSTCLIVAQSIGLFEALAEEPLEARRLSRKLGLDPLGIKRLLEVLRVSGYVSYSDNRYQLTEISRMSLLKGSSLELTNWVEFCQVQIRALSHLQDVLSTGHPVDLFDLLPGDTGVLLHQRAMAETAKPIADWVAANIPIHPGSRIMLDVGGSHGLYSAAVCRLHPPLAADVMELSSVLEFARVVSTEYSTNQFVNHIEGDIVNSPIPKTYDVVFLGNLIHHLSNSNAHIALGKIFSCLRPGGTIAVWDMSSTEQEHDDTSACFSLFFYLTSGTRCYSESEIRKLLAECGYSSIQIIHPSAISSHVLYTARKQSDAQ